MDAKLKADWIAALRSGEYKQGQDALENDGAFCCLGVLCKVAGYRIDTERDRAIRPNGSPDSQSYGALADLGLAKPLREPLIEMNDKGRSFAEIADYIEREIPS